MRVLEKIYYLHREGKRLDYKAVPLKINMGIYVWEKFRWEFEPKDHGLVEFLLDGSIKINGIPVEVDYENREVLNLTWASNRK